MKLYNKLACCCIQNIFLAKTGLPEILLLGIFTGGTIKGWSSLKTVQVRLASSGPISLNIFLPVVNNS